LARRHAEHAARLNQRVPAASRTAAALEPVKR
jgi:hypothetical protein